MECTANFKDTCGALRKVTGSESSKIKAFKKEIDGLIFVKERAVPINYDGEITICERPLRAQTMQGERVALASSEEIPAGATIEFTVLYQLPQHGEAIKEWLDYGMYRGLGQWRNSVVKCKAGEKFDREKGLALCVMKRALGDGYKKAFHKWIPVIEAKEKKVPKTCATCLHKHMLVWNFPCRICVHSTHNMWEPLPGCRTCINCKYLKDTSVCNPCARCGGPMNPDKWETAG